MPPKGKNRFRWYLYQVSPIGNTNQSRLEVELRTLQGGMEFRLTGLVLS